MAKVAVIYPGDLDCFRISINSQLKNFIEINDADVFMLASKHSHIKVVNEILNGSKFRSAITKEDEDIVKNTFGSRLKAFKYIEDIPDYEHEAQLQVEKLLERTKWIKYTGKFIQYWSPENNQVAEPRYYIDRFIRMKYLIGMVEDHEQQTGIKYDWMIRFRVDFLLNRCPYNIHEIIKTYNGGDEFHWDTVEAIWAGTPEPFKYFAKNLVEVAGKYRGGTITDRGDYSLCRITQSRGLINEMAENGIKIKHIPVGIGVTLYKENYKIFIKSHPMSEPVRTQENKTFEEYYGTQPHEPYQPVHDVNAPYLFVYTFF